MITGRPRLTAEQLSAHRTTVPGTVDQIWSPLFDYQTYPNAGTTNLTFFTQPIGQGTTSALGAAGAKTIADTNLRGAGILPKGNRFYCRGIEVPFYPGVAPAIGPVAAASNVSEFTTDVWAFSRGGVLTFTIQDRIYAQDTPLIQFPPVTRLGGWSSQADTTTAGAAQFTLTNYAVACGNPYQIVPVYIEETQGFSVGIAWPAAVALPSATDARTGVRLLGELIRNAQ